MAAIDVDASFRSPEDCLENLANLLNCERKKLLEDVKTSLAAANAINLWRNLFNPRQLMNSFFSQPRLRILQLNLYKSKSATQQLILNMEARNIDVAMVQEPHSYKGFLVFHRLTEFSSVILLT
ncbi:hypothetical protein TNCV_1271891 [Trichonephila clavipes]|nr:hypothetical protein TNCV_1271891 [Trichonephila clavipes]